MKLASPYLSCGAVLRNRSVCRGLGNCCIAISMISTGALFVVSVAPSVSARQSSSRESTIRPCTAATDQLGNARPSKPHKKRRAAPSALTDACLEVRSSALVVQERLQKFVRDQNWSVDNEQIDENLWTFHRELSPQELLAYAKPEQSALRVEWRRGRATLLIRTVELGDGFSRTTVTAKFDGYGDLEDALATQRSSWSLFSNGQLEAKLADGLRSAYQTTP